MALGMPAHHAGNCDALGDRYTGTATENLAVAATTIERERGGNMMHFSTSAEMNYEGYCK